MEYTNNISTSAKPKVSSKRSPLMVGLSIAFTLLVLIASLVPFLYDVLMSVKEYIPFKGLVRSTHVGLKNYQKLINSPYFSRLLSNTIVQSFLFGIFLFIISVILGYIIISLPSKSILHNIIVTFTLIPVFIPDVVYVGWFMSLPFSPFSTKPFVTPNIAVWFIPLIRTIKYVGIPVSMVSILSELGKKRNPLLPLQTGACFTLFSLMFIAVNDITITFLVSNPLIYEVVDSFNLFIYRSGLINAEFSYAATITIISRFLCLISAAIFSIPFIILARNLFGKNPFNENMDNTTYNEDKWENGKTSYDDIVNGEISSDQIINDETLNEEAFGTEKSNIRNSSNIDNINNMGNIGIIGNMSNLISTLIAIILIFITAAFPYLAKSVNIFDSEAISMIFQNPNTLNNFPLYVLISLIAACINVGFAAILAYPLVCGSKISKRISIVLLLFIAILASTPVSIGSFLLFKSLGMFNRVYAVIFGLVFPITCVWAFVAIANSQGVPEKIGYSKAVSKPALALVMVQMVYCLNNFLPSLIYISDIRLRSPILAYREIALVGNEIARQLPQYDAIVFWYGIILSIIPIGILAVLRTYPKKVSLLSILGIAHRK